MRFARFALTSAFFLCSLEAFSQSGQNINCDLGVHITTAERSIRQDGVLLAKELVTLPDRLPLVAKRFNAEVSYLVDTTACATHAEVAIYSYRIGAPYTIKVGMSQLNAWLPQEGLRDALVRSTFNQHVYNGRTPMVFALPTGTTRAEITLTSTPFLSVGLTGLTIGAYKSIVSIHAQEHEKIAYASDFVAWLSLVIGLTTFGLAFKRPLASGLHWFALGCCLWAIRNLLYISNIFPNAGFAIEILISYGIQFSAFALAITILIFNRMWSPRVASAALKSLGGLTLAHIATFLIQDLAIPLRTIGNVLVSFTLIWIAILLIRRRQYLLPVCLIFTVACGIHDAFIGLGILSPIKSPLAFWGFSSLIISMAIMNAINAVNALNRAQNANVELEETIAQKNAELKLYYDAEQAEKIRHERSRINREIHDGIGAQLMTALRGVERGALSQEQISESLQEGLDELRLLMDSADIGSDLHGALFAWRNRWEPRLTAVNTSLHWVVSDEVEAVQLTQETILQIIRILQESIANVVKHARATVIDVYVQVNQSELSMRVCDNGIGLTGAQITNSNRGLRNMKQRAEQIGANCLIQDRHDGEPGTEVLLRLALQPT